MPIIRLILLLGIAAALLLFALQNWAPSMQLVFLGIRSPAFPLALWVLGAIAAGILTTLTIAGLFRLTGFSAQRPRGRRPASVAQNASDRYSSQIPKETEVAQSRATSSTIRDENGSDWDDDASDWFDDETDDRPKSWESDTRRRADNQTRQETRSDPGVKPESVVDADFRVIVPPYRKLDREVTDDEK